jgi:predicted PurR-regulated permease PerM
MSETGPPSSGDDTTRMPRWLWRGIVLFWLGYLATLVLRVTVLRLGNLLLLLLVSLFLSLAIEPAVKVMSARGWRRGSATIVILLAVVAAFLVFVVAIGSLVASQVADLLRNSETYVTRTVDFINDTFDTNIDPADVIDEIRSPDGPVQQFITNQSGRALRLSAAALGLVFQALTVLLFTFYLVADGPKLRHAICSRMREDRQHRFLSAWELAIDKTGGYLYSRVLLAGLSALFHWILFQSIGTQAPVALALWVGFMSQFLPVVGTYLAGVLPILVTLIDSPIEALIVGIGILLYQQIENYLFSPRITARTMELHPALAFGSAIAGGAVLGVVGAVLALPAAAMAQALLGHAGPRYDVVGSPLTQIPGRASPDPARPPVAGGADDEPT